MKKQYQVPAIEIVETCGTPILELSAKDEVGNKQQLSNSRNEDSWDDED